MCFSCRIDGETGEEEGHLHRARRTGCDGHNSLGFVHLLRVVEVGVGMPRNGVKPRCAPSAHFFDWCNAIFAIFPICRAPRPDPVTRLVKSHSETRGLVSRCDTDIIESSIDEPADALPVLSP